MTRSIRIIPATMLVAFLLLGFKVGEVMRDGRNIILSFSTEAHAQQLTPQSPSSASTSSTPAASTPAASSPASGTATAPSKPAEAKEEPGKKEEPKANSSATNSDETEEDEAAKHEFSQVEIDILQSLAKRRQELDDWAKQVQLKENMLIAVEDRIDEKTNNLQKMKKEVETLLAKYNEQEDMKIRSLVKIYESMKPKDAARIFEELDMPVLLTVVDKMSERKVAGILTYMSPQKAKDLTIQLTEQRKLQKNRTAALASTAAQPANGQAPAATPAAAEAPAASPPSAPAAR